MDVSHELGALRFVVDSPLSSKVAMFNQQVNQHKQSQLLNPFSQADGRASPKPSFSRDEYGKPLAGSLTEMRGQKANMHVLKEMLELCQIIDSEGYNVKDEPTMRVIPFGELFNIYNYISDKVVGILLRARKHKLVEFEGEMLFQRRDDDVPIFLIKPIQEIRQELNEKIDSIKRSGSASPQATTVLLDKKAHGLCVPRGASPRSSVSPMSSPYGSKAPTPVREIAPPKVYINEEEVESPTSTEISKTPVCQTTESKENSMPNEKAAVQAEVKPETKESPILNEIPATQTEVKPESKESPTPNQTPAAQIEVQSEIKENTTQNETPAVETDIKLEAKESLTPNEIPAAQAEIKSDVNNNNDDLPTVVIEATAVFHASAKTEETTAAESNTTAPSDPTVTAASA